MAPAIPWCDRAGPMAPAPEPVADGAARPRSP